MRRKHDMHPFCSIGLRTPFPYPFPSFAIHFAVSTKCHKSVKISNDEAIFHLDLRDLTSFPSFYCLQRSQGSELPHEEFHLLLEGC